MLYLFECCVALSCSVCCGSSGGYVIVFLFFLIKYMLRHVLMGKKSTLEMTLALARSKPCRKNISSSVGRWSIPNFLELLESTKFQRNAHDSLTLTLSLVLDQGQTHTHIQKKRNQYMFIAPKTNHVDSH